MAQQGQSACYNIVTRLLIDTNEDLYQPKEKRIAPTPIDMAPRPGKKTIGNRRTGLSKGHKTRKGILPWDKDPMINRRMELVERLWAQGYSAAQTVAPVNSWCEEMGVPTVSLRTVKRDRARCLKRFEEASEDTKVEHIEALKLVKRKAWEDHDATPVGSLNKSAYLNTIRATEETIAKLDGSFKERIEIDGAFQVQVAAGLLVDVLLRRIDPDTAEVVIKEWQDAITMHEAKVVSESK